MKKRHIIIIILVILILAAMIGIPIYHVNFRKNKSYKIQEVKQYNYFILKQNDLYGVIDRKGNIVITPEYNEIVIPNPEKGIFVCYQEDKAIILNEKTEQLFTQYDSVEPIRLKNITSDLMYEKSVFKYRKDGKYGVIHFEGKEITKAIYDEIESLSYKEGELLVSQEEKYGVIDIAGNKMTEIIYDKISVDGYYTDKNLYEYAGYVVAVKTQEGYRYGYLNYKGKEILKTEYNDILRVKEILDNDNFYLICAKNGQYGMMKNESQILESEYQSIRYDATNKVLVVEKSKKYGIASLEGNIIVPIQYNQIDITGAYIYAENEQGTTVYNSKGVKADIDSKISILNTNHEEYKIKINNENGTKYGVIDQDEKPLIEEKYNYIEYLYDNYFIVSNENGKLGIVDDQDAIKVELNKDSLQKIQDTELIQATLTENKIVQIYSKTMNKICEMQNAILEEKNDYIKIYNTSEIRYFDKEGKELKNTEVYPNNKLFVKIENNHYGFVNSNGELVIENKYDKAYEFNEYGYAAVMKDEKWGAIDEEGKEVIAPTYELKNQGEPSFIGIYYRVTYGFGEFYYTNDKK